MKTRYLLTVSLIACLYGASATAGGIMMPGAPSIAPPPQNPSLPAGSGGPFTRPTMPTVPANPNNYSMPNTLSCGNQLAANLGLCYQAHVNALNGCIAIYGGRNRISIYNWDYCDSIADNLSIGCEALANANYRACLSPRGSPVA